MYDKSGIFNTDLSQPSKLFDLTTAAGHTSKHDTSAGTGTRNGTYST